MQLTPPWLDGTPPTLPMLETLDNTSSCLPSNSSNLQPIKYSVTDGANPAANQIQCYWWCKPCSQSNTVLHVQMFQTMQPITANTADNQIQCYIYYKLWSQSNTELHCTLYQDSAANQIHGCIVPYSAATYSQIQGCIVKNSTANQMQCYRCNKLCSKSNTGLHYNRLCSQSNIGFDCNKLCSQWNTVWKKLQPIKYIVYLK